jgi:hypothetical protein
MRSCLRRKPAAAARPRLPPKPLVSARDPRQYKNLAQRPARDAATTRRTQPQQPMTSMAAALAPKAVQAARSLRAGGDPALARHALRALHSSRLAAMGIGSHISDNDADVLEREKRRSLECERPIARGPEPAPAGGCGTRARGPPPAGGDATAPAPPQPRRTSPASFPTPEAGTSTSRPTLRPW